MTTGTVNLKRVAALRPSASSIPGTRCHTEMAASLQFHLPDLPHGCPGWRLIQMSFVISAAEPLVWRRNYLELAPFEKIHYSDRFDDPNLPGQMHTTISLRQVSCGTELTIKQTGLPEVIPVEMCYLGWQESLVQLAKLVEPEIPD